MVYFNDIVRGLEDLFMIFYSYVYQEVPNALAASTVSAAGVVMVTGICCYAPFRIIAWLKGESGV